MKRVSIITPCYNGGVYLREYLLSIAAQTYRPLELVFVNDGSTDDSELIFEKAKPELNLAGVETKYIKTDHVGQAFAVNAGLKVFSGEYLSWADADDILYPLCIEKKAEYLDNHPDCDMVRNDVCIVKDGIFSSRVSDESDRKTANLFEKLFMEQTYVFAGCYMIRRSLFLECYPSLDIPFSPEGQNLQMLLPAASRAYCGFVDEILMAYRVHEDSHSFRRRTLKECDERIRGFEKLYKDLKPYCKYDGTLYDKMLNDRIRLLRSQLLGKIRELYRGKYEKDLKIQ